MVLFDQRSQPDVPANQFGPARYLGMESIHSVPGVEPWRLRTVRRRKADRRDLFSCDVEPVELLYVKAERQYTAERRCCEIKDNQFRRVVANSGAIFVKSVGQEFAGLFACVAKQQFQVSLFDQGTVGKQVEAVKALYCFRTVADKENTSGLFCGWYWR